MRKILILAALAAVFVSSAASADQTCLPHWVNAPLKMRTSASNTVGYRDSTSFANTAAAAETTVAFPLFEMAQLPNLAAVAASTVDSVDFLTLRITPRAVTGITNEGDSVYVFTQVSQDGRSWSNMTPTRTFLPAITLANGLAVLEATSDMDYFAYTFKQGYSEALGWYKSLEGTAPSTLQWFGWRFVRWIVYSDLNGTFEVSVDYISRACQD